MSKRMPTVKELEAARKAADKVMLTSILANASKTASKAAEDKTSAPSSAGLTVKPAATTTPVPPTVLPKVSSLGLLNPEIVNKYLQQGMAYAKQGPQSRMDIANSLLGFDIGDYKKGDVAGFNYDTMQEMNIRNRYFIGQHQRAGTFDFPEFLTDKYIAFPSTDYLTKQNDAVMAALEESKAKDAAAAASKEQNADQEAAWQNLYKAKQEEKDFFDEWYNLLLADHLLNNSGQIWDFEAADARYGEDVMDDATYESELKRLREQMQGVDWATKTGYNTANYESQTPALQAKYDLISGQLQNRNKAAELEAFVRSQPDFDEKRLYVDNYTAPEKGSLSYIFSNDAFVQGLDDPLRYMHADVNWASRELAGEYSGKAKYYFEHGYHLMAPEQLDTYTYLYQSERYKEAADYIAAIQPELNKAMSDIVTEFYTTRDETIPGAIIDSLWSVPGKIKGTLDTGAGVLMGKDDPNDPLYRTAQNVDTIRGVSGQTAGELLPFEVFGQKAGTFLYGLGMSTLDMIAAQKLAGIFGTATGKADTMKNIMGAIMATEAGTDTFRDDLERGMGFEYSLGHGIANGLVNRWAESGFLDNLFSENGKFLTKVLKSGASEGLEEVFESGMNLGTDAFVSYLTGKQNEIEQTYNYYVATVGKDKAAAATMQHYANQFAADGLAGFIMGGTTSAVYNTGEYLDTRSYGEGIVNNGDADTILKIAQGMAEDSESKHIADAITGKQGKGKKPSFYKFGQLTKALVKDLGAEHADIINKVQDEAIAGRLQELGDDAETAKKNAPIIRKVYRGEKLTMDERAAVRWNDRADKVTKELIRENNYTGDQPVPIKWVKGMKETQASESADVIGKQLQVQVATVTPIGKAANRAEEAAKKRVPKRDGKPKLATDSHVTFRAADGSAEISGDIMRFEESDEGMQVVVQTSKGKEGEQKAKLKDWISADGDGVATILSYIGDDQLPHSVTAEEANTLMQVYKHSGGNAKAVIQAFDVNYLAGYSGNDQVGSVLDPALSKIAYENGKRDAEKDEAQRKQRASEYKALENPVAGWIGKVDGREQVKGLGDAKALEEALQAMPESQRTAAEIMIETGKAVGLNVVLYDSDGKGAENDIQNGMFEGATHTVYFDASAWAGNEKRVQALKKEGTLGYAMLRVGGHELTHYLEVAAPEAYAKYSKAVKDALKAKGVDFAVQMRERIDKANAQGRKLTMAGAAAEVIADASENMLQDSKLFNRLDTDTKSKIRAFLQNFAQKVKEIFQNLTGGHKESAALREMKNGVYHYLEGLQDLWDAGFDEILAKGTEDLFGDATEMVDSIPVEELEATRKFSMGRDVELREDGLIAMHNLKESDVRGTLALGGFPMPSIAIVKAKDGHTMYGDYSVLFGKETIDPANKKNRVYGADAWTPVFPHVETQIHDDILYDVQEGFRDLAAQVDEEYGKKARIWFGNFSGSDVTSKSLDDIAESAANNTGVMAAYLADHGETVEVVETDAPVDQGYKPEHADQYDKILDIIDMNDYFNMPMHELLDTYGDRLAEVSTQMSRLNAHWKTGDRRSGAVMARVLKEAIAYEGSGRDKTVKTKRVKDYYATDDAIRARVDRKDVEAWAKEKLAPAFGEQGIYNGKDRFTPSGNRRSFKQTHNALTADNVVKSMLTQEESAIPVTDAKGLMAAAASMYKSIAEIKGDVNRLGKISEEEYNARIAAADNAFHDFLNAVEAWDYDQIQDVGKLLVQAAKGRMDAKAISALLKRNGFPKATIKASIMAENVIQQVQNIPTGYFEAKPARVVGFDEIRMIVAPDTMPESLAELLDKRGIPYTTYDGSDADRLEKVNAVEGVRFSDRDAYLLDGSEYGRFRRNWESRKTNHFTKRTNGGVLIDMGNLLVYTDRKGNPQHVLEVMTEDLWEENDIVQRAILLETGGYDKDEQQEILGRIFPEGSFRFRIPGDRSSNRGQNGRGSKRDVGKVRREDREEQSYEGAPPEVQVKRYSDRDLPEGVTIREYLGAMKPTSSMTETEKLLLKRYQDQLRTLEEKEKLVEEQEEIIRTAPFRNPDGSLNDEITKAKNRYKIYRDQANRAARALANAEKDEGFARLMATSRQVVNDYLLGAAGNVADAQDVLESEINELTRQLTKLEADVTRTSQGQRTAFARGLYNPDDLKAAAQKLKDTYGSRMSVQNIANRLALAYGELYANDGAEGGKMFMAASRDLATDLLAGNKFRYKSEILPMLREQIGTISLSDTDLQEIGNAGLTVTEYKRMLSPYIKVSAEGSDLSSYASNAEYYGNGVLAAVLGDENEGNLAMRLYDVINQEKAKEADNGYDGMSESQLIGMAMADIAGANLPMSANSSTVEYLRKELLKYAGENAEVAITVEEAISKAKKATAKAGRIWLEAAKNTETARQAVEYYRALDEKRRVMELAEQKKQITEQLKSDTAKKLQEKVTAQREEYREREKKAREYRKTRDEVDKLHRKISRNVKRLNTLRVRETDQKHVPQELQHVADAVMSTFTDSELGRLVFHEAKLMNLARTYRLLRQSETDAAYFWDDEIETDINNLQALGEAYGALRNREGSAPSRFSLEGVELETEILQGVDAIVSHVLNMIDATNTGFLYQRNETFTQFANKAGEKLRGHKDYKNLKGALGRIQHMLDENLRTGNTTPVYFFEHLENQEIMDVFDEIRKGMRQAAIIEREGKQFIEKAREQYNYGSWVADGKLTMKTSQGHTIELTREEAAEIYAIAKREAANKLYQTEHLLYGGFNYKHIDEKGKGLVRVKDESHQLDKADIAKISSWLTAEQKAYADALVGFLSTDMADYGNDASMKMYGYKKFTEQYYIPFHTVKNQLFQKGDEGPQGENAGTGRVKNSGFTHKVQYKAKQALYVGGISETVADHIHKMAAYAAMVEPIENMKRLLNHKMLETDGTSNTIRALIGQKYGQASEDYMTQLLKDLNGATMGDKRASGLTDKMIGAFKRGAVMASASVVLQQPTAMTRAMAMISPKYFTNNPFYRPGKGTWNEMLEHSGTAVIKDMGKFDVGMGLTATQYILDEDLNVVEAYQRLKAESKSMPGKAVYDSFMAWLTAAPGKADQWTWGLIWKAVKAEQADLHPDMDQTSDAFLDLVGERFDDVIDHTQVYDSVLSRSNLMRSQDGIAKAITVFKSEPTLSLNMLYDALSGWKSKRHTGMHRGRIIGSVLASQILAGAMAALAQAWNDDDDKRTAIEKYADRATGNIVDNLNPLKMIPLVSDIVSMCEGYDVARPDMEIVGDAINYSKSFFDKAFDPDKALGWKDYENFLGTIANMVGIPAKNLLREGRRAWNAVVNTQWTAPTGINVGQAMLENMPFYSDKNNEYYQRIVTAKVRGDDELAEDLRTYMLTSKMVKEEALTKGIREAYQARYEKGGIEKDDAINFLLENNLVTGETEADRKKSAFGYVDRWEEGTENYSAYNTLKDAYGKIDYTAISKAWKELTNYGYTDEQVKEESRKLLRKLVEAGTISPNQATQILRKWCSYKADSDNLEKPREWIKDKK